MPLPDTTIDQLFKLKSPIADWNSNASSNKNKVTANRHHRRQFQLIQRFFLDKLERHPAKTNNSPPQSAVLAGWVNFVLDCFFHS